MMLSPPPNRLTPVVVPHLSRSSAESAASAYQNSSSEPVV
jgi:hypothetical protein